MKVLLTGASGFVGGAVWRRCRELGWTVIATGRTALPDAGYIQHDLTEPFRLEFKPDVVIHAAARSSPWGSRRQFTAQNVVATEHVLDFCRAQGRPHLIYLSTSAVLYRNEHQFDLDETTPPPEHQINEYSRTKLEGEQLVSGYDGPWTILRPRAVFGPGDTVVFPRILKAARKGRFPLIQSDQPAWADLIYIDSLADYIVRVVRQRAVGLFHLTNQQPVPILAFLGDVFRRLGLPEPTLKIPAARAHRAAWALESAYRFLPFLGEPPLTRFGVSVFAYSKTLAAGKALRELGPPSHSLDQGVHAFIAWQKARL
jgi:nucleoside-diphosphate-sugar epimerase